MLIVGSLLMVVAGVVFASTNIFVVLVLAATIGVISPTGNEVGPFLAIEQAALSQTIPDARRTPTFAWYNLAGYVATAFGALAAGSSARSSSRPASSPADAYRAVVIGYALIGLVMALVFWRVGAAIEAPPVAADDGIRRRLGLGRSRGIIGRLSALFALDAFGGGFIPQSLMAYWFHLQYGVEPGGPRRDLLRRQPAGGRVLAARAADRGPDRARPDDGLHPSSRRTSC